MNEKEIRFKNGSFYDLVNELRAEIKRKYPDAIIGEMLVKRENYSEFPNREPIIDDSEVLESIRRGDYTPNEDT